MCVVVNSTAIIGDNCNLSQFVSIGSNKDKSAVIGDCVYIGPNNCIVENVVIGNNSVIGAGAVIVKDVKENVTVAGVAGKIISNNDSHLYIHNKFIK